MRPHMYNGPPGPNMPPNQGPYMSGPRPMHQRPMGYEGQSRMAPMPYPMAGLFPNMMMSQPRGDYAISRRTPGRDEDSDDDYTSSESDRSRNKPRKHNEDKESSYDKKKSESSPEKTKAEADENKDDIKNQNQKETPSNIVIKSFDEIMREKRQRRQQGQAEKTEPAQPSQEPTTIRRPTIIRKKPISTQPTSGLLTKSSLSEPSSPGRSEPASPDIISQSVAEPSSPGKSEPDSPDIITQSVAEPSSHQSHENMLSRTVRQIKDPSFHPTHKAASLEDETGSPPCVSVGDADDSDDDDDDSWEHEELPAVPLLTPTLESPAEIPDNLSSDSHKTAAVLRIPGMTTQAETTQGHVSPTKRPRSSLEELFGVPCDEADSKPDKEILSDVEDEENKDVSPAKKVKTHQATYDAIVKAVNKEMSKKDDFDLELEEEIANLSPDKHYDAHESLNEDDLLLELEEMIND
ncbi:hypothetical protein QZH41_002102 [Actinostola sp. cb2023]|nr:hypothetical protein QZH41_002102 [Actinostola sp. cb2023]